MKTPANTNYNDNKNYIVEMMSKIIITVTTKLTDPPIPRPLL